MCFKITNLNMLLLLEILQRLLSQTLSFPHLWNRRNNRPASQGSLSGSEQYLAQSKLALSEC